jgi:hypothetical protein
MEVHMKSGIPLLTITALCALGLVRLADPGSCQGRSLSETEVSTAVLTWVQFYTPDAKPSASVRSVRPYPAQDAIAAYIVEFEEGGFCLAGADTLLLPVYLYRPQGAYDPDQAGIQDFLDEITGRLQFLTQLTTAQQAVPMDLSAHLTDRDRLWRDLIAGRNPVLPRREVAKANLALMNKYPTPAEPDVLALPMRSQWHQGSPYNDQLPLHPQANQRVLVGCNATAQAQIMYYWKWPSSGVGSASVDYPYRWRTTWDEESLGSNPGIPNGWSGRLEWTSANGGRLRMNGNWDRSVYEAAQNISLNSSSYQTALTNLFKRLNQNTVTASANFATTYHWDQMEDVNTPGSSGGAEVAKLSAHASISSHSGLGIWSTGSSFRQWTLQTNFYYDKDITFYPTITNASGTANSFIQELQWSRVIALGGSGAPGGHAYVVYGYDRTNPSHIMFLMNFGWTDPDSWRAWYGLDTTPFPNNQDHLVKIAPAGAVRFVGGEIFGDGSPSNPYWNLAAAVTDAPSGATLILKAGTLNPFSGGPLVISKPLTIKGNQSMINKL